MAVRTPEESDAPFIRVPRGPSLTEALALGALLLVLLLANGRPIAAAPPAPPLLSLLAAPFFLLARGLFALDATGTALVGKAVASLLSALGAAALFLAVGRRHPEADARDTALLLALGGSVWAASQALQPQAAGALFVSLVVLALLKAEHDPAWAGRAGLPLGLALAANPGATALTAVLFLGLAARWPRRLPLLLLWTLPGLALALYPSTTSLAGPADALDPGPLGLLASPVRGLLVFTPVAAVAGAGLLRAFVRGERALAATLGGAALAHWLQAGLAPPRAGGGGWGPILLTDALPLLFLFLPEGFALWPRVGAALALVSVLVQALGAFAYDRRWDRLNEPLGPALLWDPAKSPIVLAVEERVIRLALPAVKGGKAWVCEHPLVLFGPEGSRVAFGGPAVVVTGAEGLLGDVHAEGGARVKEGRLRLSRPGDALFLRVRSRAQKRRLELRIAGRGQGTLWVGERTFWSETPRAASYPLEGDFKLRHRYYYPESGGDDITIELRAPGSVELITVALVAPGEPENVIRLP